VRLPRQSSGGFDRHAPLHGFLPFPHVDHLHPDWGIALAASANGKVKMEEFNREFGHSLVWLPWQRPGFELAMMMKRAAEQNPAAMGLCWAPLDCLPGADARARVLSDTLTVIDQIGQFIERHGNAKRDGFGSRRNRYRRARTAGIWRSRSRPFYAADQRAAAMIVSFTDAPDVLQFVNSVHAKRACFPGNELPGSLYPHKIRPLFVPWETGADLTR